MIMAKGLTAKSSVHVNAPVTEVWEALTTPELIKQYLFGTEAISDWKEGSEIIYKGEWEGKSYEDKGVIKKIVPEKILQSTYWSSMSGTEDSPENYVLVTYELHPADGGTDLVVTQDNCKTEESRQHSEQNWNKVLSGLKKVVEQ
jgi:uncharacterized protein YndB with AHSA1/START domain